MGNIGDPITPAVPTVGSAGPNYATDINLILAEVVARLSNRVPLVSLSTNSVLGMAGSPITDVGYLTLANTLATPGSSPTNRLTAFAGNLYYVSPTGVIQLTAGGSLNAAGVGGITGDYTSVGPMQFRYTTATTKYDAYSNFGTGTFAFLRAQGLEVAASPTSAFFARLMFAGAANKTYTLPPTQPTTNQLPLYMDSSGNITAGHSSRIIPFAPYGMMGDNTTPVISGQAIGVTKAAGAQTGRLTLTGLPIGFVITAFTVDMTKSNASSVTFNLNKLVAGTSTNLATGSSIATGLLSLTTALGVAETVDSGEKFSFEFIFDTGAGTTVVHGFSVTGSIPV